MIEQMDLPCVLDCGTLKTLTLNCGKLKTLTLACVEGESYAVRMGIRVDAIFAPLAQWVQQDIYLHQGQFALEGGVRALGINISSRKCVK